MGHIPVNGRSTVRIVNEAIAIIELLASEVKVASIIGDEERLDNNLLELRDLAGALHRKYPIMRTGD